MNMNSSFHQKLSSPDYVTVPIIGYEVMEERERFTVKKRYLNIWKFND